MTTVVMPWSCRDVIRLCLIFALFYVIIISFQYTLYSAVILKKNSTALTSDNDAFFETVPQNSLEEKALNNELAEIFSKYQNAKSKIERRDEPISSDYLYKTLPDNLPAEILKDTGEIDKSDSNRRKWQLNRSPLANHINKQEISKEIKNELSESIGEDDKSDLNHRKWQLKIALDIPTEQKSQNGKIKINVKSSSNSNQGEIKTDEKVRLKFEYKRNKSLDHQKRELGNEDKMLIKIDYANKKGQGKILSEPEIILKVQLNEFLEKRKEQLTLHRIKEGKWNAANDLKKNSRRQEVQRQEKNIKKLPKNYLKMSRKSRKLASRRKMYKNIRVNDHQKVKKKDIRKKYNKMITQDRTASHAGMKYRTKNIKREMLKKRDNVLEQEQNKRRDKNSNPASSKSDIHKQNEMKFFFFEPLEGKSKWDYFDWNKEQKVKKAKDDDVKKKEFKPISLQNNNIKTKELQIFKNVEPFDTILRRFFPSLQSKHIIKKRSTDSEEQIEDDQQEDITDENVDSLRVLVKREDAANVVEKTEKNAAKSDISKQDAKSLQKDIKKLGKENAAKRNEKVKFSKKGKVQSKKLDTQDVTNKLKQKMEAEKSVKVRRESDDDGNDENQRMIVTGDELTDNQASHAQKHDQEVEEEDEEEEEEEEEEKEEKNAEQDQRVKRYRPKRFYIDVEDGDGRRHRRYDNDLRHEKENNREKSNRRRRYYYDDDDYRPKRHDDDDDDDDVMKRHNDDDDDSREEYEKRDDDGDDKYNMLDESNQGENDRGEEEEEEEEEKEEDVKEEEDEEEKEKNANKRHKDKEILSEREVEDVEDKTELAKRSAAAKDKSSSDIKVIASDETAEKDVIATDETALKDVIAIDKTAEKEKEKEIALNANEELETAKRESEKVKLANAATKLLGENQKLVKEQRSVADEAKSEEAMKKKLAKKSKKKAKEKAVKELAEQAHAAEKRRAEESKDVEDLDSYFADKLQRRRYIRSAGKHQQKSDVGILKENRLRFV